MAVSDWRVAPSKEYWHATDAVRSDLASAQLQRKLATEQWDWTKNWYQQQNQLAAGQFDWLKGLTSKYNMDYASARNANEARYQDILRQRNTARDVRSEQIAQQGQNQISDIQQSLARIGLANTSANVGGALSRAVNTETQQAIDVSKLAFNEPKWQFMERKTDEYPDPNLILNLAQILGKSTGNNPQIASSLSSLGNVKIA